MEKQQEEKIISMYSKRRSLKAIRRETGLTETVIKKWLVEKGLWTGHKWLPYYFDEFFFDKIDTEEKAYWLGFIYADGYLTMKTNAIGIELKETDKSHLEKFREALHSEQEVKIYHKNSTYGPQVNCRFVFSSKHMKEILLSYYKSVNKTFNGEFPKIQREDLIPHLIRGFFDGDGCLTWSNKEEGHIITPLIGFIGTKETLQYIEKISNIEWRWSQQVADKTKNNYQIQCGKVNDSLSFLDYMYKDATVYLDRKYEKYQTLIQNRQKYSAKARV